MPARTLVPEASGLLDPTSVGEENETFFIRRWKSILKTLRETTKIKSK